MVRSSDSVCPAHAVVTLQGHLGLSLSEIHGGAEIELPCITHLLSERAEAESMSDKHQIPHSFSYIASQMAMSKIEKCLSSSVHHWL